MKMPALLVALWSASILGWAQPAPMPGNPPALGRPLDLEHDLAAERSPPQSSTRPGPTMPFAAKEATGHVNESMVSESGHGFSPSVQHNGGVVPAGVQGQPGEDVASMVDGPDRRDAPLLTTPPAFAGFGSGVEERGFARDENALRPSTAAHRLRDRLSNRKPLPGAIRFP